MMSQSLIFFKHPSTLSAEAAAHNMRLLFHLNHESFPQAVLAEDDTAVSLPEGSTLYQVCPISNDVVMAFLLRARGSVVFLLPEDTYGAWRKLLLGDAHAKAVAFSLRLVTDTFTTRLQWALGKKGRVLLPAASDVPQHPEDAIHAILMEKEEKIEESLLRLFQDIDDDEAPHKIRVNARTLRSLLDFLKPWTDKRTNRALRTLLRDLARDFSDIREQDVLVKQITAYHKRHEDSLTQYDDLVDHITGQRQDHMNDLLREAIQQNTLAAVPNLVKGLQALNLRGDNLAHAINQRYYNDFLAFQLRADVHDYTDVEATHDLRKEAKRLRYVLENLGRWIPAVDSDMAAHFKDIQTELGDLCDARNNQDRLKALQEDGIPYQDDCQTLIDYNRAQEIDILKDLGVDLTDNQPEPTPDTPADAAANDTAINPDVVNTTPDMTAPANEHEPEADKTAETEETGEDSPAPPANEPAEAKETEEP